MNAVGVYEADADSKSWIEDTTAESSFRNGPSVVLKFPTLAKMAEVDLRIVYRPTTMDSTMLPPSEGFDPGNIEFKGDYNWLNTDSLSFRIKLASEELLYASIVLAVPEQTGMDYVSANVDIKAGKYSFTSRILLYNNACSNTVKFVVDGTPIIDVLSNREGSNLLKSIQDPENTTASLTSESMHATILGEKLYLLEHNSDPSVLTKYLRETQYANTEEYFQGLADVYNETKTYDFCTEPDHKKVLSVERAPYLSEDGQWINSFLLVWPDNTKEKVEEWDGDKTMLNIYYGIISDLVDAGSLFGMD